MAYYVILGQSKKLTENDNCKYERFDDTKDFNFAKNLANNKRWLYPDWTFWIDKIED